MKLEPRNWELVPDERFNAYFKRQFANESTNINKKQIITYGRYQNYLQPCLNPVSRFKVGTPGLPEPFSVRFGCLLGAGSEIARKVKLRKADGANCR